MEENADEMNSEWSRLNNVAEGTTSARNGELCKLELCTYEVFHATHHTPQRTLRSAAQAERGTAAGEP